MKKILIIEDEPSVRANILDLLVAEDFDAIAAENGAIGVQLALSSIPDLIICDVMMPQLDGYGVVQALRQNPKTATIPFIFLTAKVGRTSLREGMSIGADDYLTKPFRPKELLKAIATRLEKQAAIDYQQAQKLNELRNSITQSLPHELRTPLNGIIAGADFLLAEYETLEPSEVHEMLCDIQTSGKRLYRLIQNFLLYAELELVATDSDRIKSLRSEQTNSVKALIANRAILQAKYRHREADLHLELQDGNVQMSINRLDKLVEELVDNAFKFSSAGTPVTVTNVVSNHLLTLTVMDQGRGLTTEQIAQVGAYRQFERKLYEQQGSGLGLMIAKQLSELHEGTLSIKSIPDQQTTVLVTLPAVDKELIQC
jgi:two-component system, sensor histidine kinase and response regulator